MVEAAKRDDARWTVEAFVAWLDDGHGGDDRWELVDGAPRMMTRPTLRHQTVVLNAGRALRERLRGGPCRPFIDAMVETGEDRTRVPDVTVDCGSPDLSTRFADEPTVVIEVLSPSTREFDQFDKHVELRGVASVRHVVLIDSERVRAAVWTRVEPGEGDRGGDWKRQQAFDLDASLALTAVGCELPMAELYEDTGLESGSP